MCKQNEKENRYNLYNQYRKKKDIYFYNDNPLDIKWIDIHYFSKSKRIDMFVFNESGSIICWSTHENMRIQDADILANMFEILYGNNAELYTYDE